jgi:phosphatidylinositol alpha-1,6-mannosyltransferase
MRVLIVTPDYPPPPGGIQTLTRNLERGLEAVGHETHLLHINPSRTSLISAIWPQTHIDHLSDVYRWPLINYIYTETDAAIAKFDPDIIHCTHTVCWPALEAGEQAGIPGLVSTHALELNRKNQALSMAKRTSRIHAVSEFTKSLTQSVLGTRGDIYVAPPSIDVPDKIPDPTPDGPVFSIARLTPRKNILSLVEAWKLMPSPLREKHGLMIAGDGEQRDEIETEAADDPTIEILCRISEDRKKQLFNNASVFALAPYRDGFDVEGFGIVYLEAQASGTPVLGSSNGGIPEAVGDGGMLVDSPSDPREIARVLKSLLTDRELRQTCQQEIQDRIGVFGLEPVAEKHVKVYRDVLNYDNN